jgi:ABC-type dipeptide/oligopeptide/nickel transport system permease subunit
MRSGVSVPIFASPGQIGFRTPSYPALDVRKTVDYAILADDLGYDSLWVADHLQLGKNGAILEGWTTLAALAGATKRAALGTIHLSNVFRHPPHVAKMAATVDQISGGRLIFFYDAGWNSVESEAYGFDFVDAPARLARMREGLELMRRLWTESGPIDHDGARYHVRSALCEPKPVQKPHPPIWIGEAGHDGLVDAAAALGQGWNSVPASPTELAAKLARLEAACQRANRDMSDLEISLGTRVSLTIGLVSVVLSLILGVVFGGISGYFGGIIDVIIQRVIEILRSIPTIPLWMGLAAALPRNWDVTQVYFAITIIISLIGWTELARVVRGRFLSLREEDFVVAADLVGCSQTRIIFRHMVPSFTSHIIAATTLALPAMIISETSLSFLGLGLRPPAISWGVLLQDAQNVQAVALSPWLLTPAVPVILAVLAFNFLGDGLRDAADPYGG